MDIGLSLFPYILVSKYCSVPHTFGSRCVYFLGMWKRLGGQHLKNEERVQRSLIVSVPRESVGISVSSSLTITLPPPLTWTGGAGCPVSIPLLVILECVVSSLERLANNLSLLNPFPAWTVASK